MIAPAGAALALSVFRNRETQAHGAQMRSLTKEIDGRFLIAVFEFSVRRTHATQRLNLTAPAFGKPRLFFAANLEQKVLPAFFYAATAPVVDLLLRDHADTHAPVGVDGKAVHATAAEVNFIAVLDHRFGRRNVVLHQ